MPLLTLPIVTARLRLRPFTLDDVDDMYAYQGRADVARYLYRPPYTRQYCADVIAAAPVAVGWDTDGDTVRLAICRRTAPGTPRDTARAPGEAARMPGGGPGVLGEVMLTLASARARQMEIGWLLHPGCTGRGYATEAARALAVAAFDQLGAHRLFARLDVRNTPSVRVCERLGMRREAYLIENDLDLDGQWGSEYVYAALAGDLAR